MIDSRIRAIMNFVREGSRVADIGADHAYLSIALANSGLAKKIIATEKNIGPFEAARKNIFAAGFGDVIDVRLGDGLQVLSAGEVDTICIAGMGGALIQKILDDAPDVVQSARQLILQPMNAAEKIRDNLAENFVVEDEDLAEASGIIYEVISAVKLPVIPKKIFKRETSPLLRKFLRQRLEKFQHVLNEMSKSPIARESENFFVVRAEFVTLQEKLRRLS